MDNRGYPVWDWTHGVLLCKSCADLVRYWKDPERRKKEVKASILKHHDRALERYRRYKDQNGNQIREKRLEYYSKNRKVLIKKRITLRRKNGSTSKRRRLELIGILGGKCVTCGYNSNTRALMVDHINGGGSKERREFGSLLRLYRYYVKNPEEAKNRLQILCANCNCIKRDERGEYWFGGTFVATKRSQTDPRP